MENPKIRKLLIALMEYQEATSQALQARYELEKSSHNVMFTELWNECVPSLKDDVDKDAFFAAKAVVVDTSSKLIVTKMAYEAAFREG
jgi:hypothetical protein